MKNNPTTRKDPTIAPQPNATVKQISPINGSVVLRSHNPDTSEGGILIPEVAKAAHDAKQLIVVAVSDPFPTANGTIVTPTLKVGDSVILAPTLAPDEALKIRSGKDVLLVVHYFHVIGTIKHLPYIGGEDN